MRRDQLEHAIRTACQIIGHDAVAVVGSQSILGSFAEDQLPAEATMSMEIDVLPLVDDDAEAARLADLIEGVAGEWSSFEEQHGSELRRRPARRRTRGRRGHLKPTAHGAGAIYSRGRTRDHLADGLALPRGVWCALTVVSSEAVGDGGGHA
jgi:hypothetical protein